MEAPPDVRVFMNETLRPLAENLRASAIISEEASRRWAMISGKVADTGEILEDGRAAEGVSQLSGSEVTKCLQMVSELLLKMDRDLLTKVSVRALNVQ